MKVYLVADTHFYHDKIAEYCDRPANHTELMIEQWNRVVRPEDLVIHLGDVQVGGNHHWVMTSFHANLLGRKILVRGNHDRSHSCMWWMDHGFDFACDGMMFRNYWLSHEPVSSIPFELNPLCIGNIHGHLHNIWQKAAPNAGLEIAATAEGHLRNPWQRLFAIEYTDYAPVEFDRFVSHSDKYQARGPTAKCFEAI